MKHLSKWFKDLFAGFDDMFEDIDKMERELNERLQKVVKSLESNNVEETVTEVETKPDGSVIRRTITIRRTVSRGSPK